MASAPRSSLRAVKLLDCLRSDFGLDIETETALVGGAAYDDSGSPLPESTLKLAKGRRCSAARGRRGPKMGAT